MQYDTPIPIQLFEFERWKDKYISNNISVNTPRIHEVPAQCT